ncbi:glucosamine-6-phosphate deaminase-like protein [Corchorus olitorius]|uniref:Glucosamine-6-phosphate deaminase-like protein n=1 Tax=Corchorus olitorius TaxID=93759 RepID=A0A1R3I678_9ROSI|nr:glucosamine-6-phosphate deaminase-like protein [Corchorus olitorius]
MKGVSRFTGGYRKYNRGTGNISRGYANSFVRNRSFSRHEKRNFNRNVGRQYRSVFRDKGKKTSSRWVPNQKSKQDKGQTSGSIEGDVKAALPDTEQQRHDDGGNINNIQFASENGKRTEINQAQTITEDGSSDEEMDGYASCEELNLEINIPEEDHL